MQGLQHMTTAGLDLVGSPLGGLVPPSSSHTPGSAGSEEGFKGTPSGKAAKKPWSEEEDRVVSQHVQVLPLPLTLTLTLAQDSSYTTHMTMIQHETCYS